MVFVLVPRTSFHGSAGAFGAFVVTGCISSAEPENANQQHGYYPHIIDLCWCGRRETPADAGGHPQGQVVLVAHIVMLCLMAIITSAFHLRQLFASASACESC